MVSVLEFLSHARSPASLFTVLTQHSNEWRSVLTQVTCTPVNPFTTAMTWKTDLASNWNILIAFSFLAIEYLQIQLFFCCVFVFYPIELHWQTCIAKYVIITLWQHAGICIQIKSKYWSDDSDGMSCGRLENSSHASTSFQRSSKLNTPRGKRLSSEMNRSTPVTLQLFLSFVCAAVSPSLVG